MRFAHFPEQTETRESYCSLWRDRKVDLLFFFRGGLLFPATTTDSDIFDEDFDGQPGTWLYTDLTTTLWPVGVDDNTTTTTTTTTTNDDDDGGGNSDDNDHDKRRRR